MMTSIGSSQRLPEPPSEMYLTVLLRFSPQALIYNNDGEIPSSGGQIYPTAAARSREGAAAIMADRRTQRVESVYKLVNGCLFGTDQILSYQLYFTIKGATKGGLFAASSSARSVFIRIQYRSQLLLLVTVMHHLAQIIH